MTVISNGALSMMSYRIDTKRPPAIVGGQRGEPELYLEFVPCTSLLPVAPEVAARFPSMTPSELLQVFVPGDNDIREGDTIVFEDVEYPVREASEWELRRTKLTALVLENVKIT